MSFIEKCVEQVFEGAEQDPEFCLTVRPKRKSSRWGQITATVFNAYYPFSTDPITHLMACGVIIPLEFEISEWTPKRFVTISYNGEISQIKIAHFITDYMTKVLELEDDDSTLQASEDF